MIMRGGRVVAATCYLPLSTNPDINKSYGTRHRAAIGISEVTDSLTIIVSEETGEVSFAVGGKMRHNLSPDELRLELEIMEQKDEERAESRSLLNRLRSRRRGRAEEVRDLLKEIDPDKEADHEE